MGKTFKSLEDADEYDAYGRELMAKDRSKRVKRHLDVASKRDAKHALSKAEKEPTMPADYYS